MHIQAQTEKFNRFKAQHTGQSTLVLPNTWDAISAKIFAASGFESIGTTSAGMAASLGYVDGENIPFAKVLEVLEDIIHAVDVPVSADIEAGYGTTVEEVVENTQQIIETGIVGINLEEGTGNPDEPIHDISLQAEKIFAIKQLSRTMDVPLFLNARTDLYWLNIGSPIERLQAALHRAKVYQEAGADCIFIPGVESIEIIETLRAEIPCPINLLVGQTTPPLSKLSEIGIERVSCGSAPFRATITLLKEMSQEILDQGEFKRMTDGTLSYHELSKLI
jgi:2-methylisocitrate lyase-like PEP mutase family enzyme